MISQWSLSWAIQLGSDFWYLDVIMFLLLGDTSLTFGPNSIVDLDDCDHAFDDGWFEVVRFSNLPYIWCHTGAYFRFDWDLKIFMELHAYHHLRDTRQDGDLLVILSWSSNGVSLGPFSQAHTFRHLHIIMLLLPGNTSLMFRPDLVANMDDCDCTFDDGWSDVVQFFDLPDIWCRTGAYFRFGWDL